MRVLPELRLATWLRLPVQELELSEGLTEPQEAELDDERAYLLNGLKEITEDGAFWSNEEWDWFLNRCLDFLGAPK